MSMNILERALAQSQRRKDRKVEWAKLESHYKHFRAVGELFPSAIHLLAAPDWKRYVCRSYDSGLEDFRSDIRCPACEAGISSKKTWFHNVIDREKQAQGDSNPIVALGINPQQQKQLGSSPPK